MSLSNPIRGPRTDRIPLFVFLAGLVVGIAFFTVYYRQGLTLAHYDAKAHLLVARRIFDSLEPGYGQMGVNWLPLIHLVYLPFVFFESQYRSGFLPSLISVLAFALSAAITYRISHRITGSVAAGLFAAAILIANPNLEYLQSCPLTEPLYMMLLLLAVNSLSAWRESDHSRQPWAAAVWLILGGLCRYEGWFVFAGVLTLLAFDFWTRYMPRRKAVQAAAVCAAVFVLPAAMHFGYIYLRLGDNFFNRVAGGAPSPYLTYKRPLLSVIYHLGELSQMSALLPLLLAGVGLFLMLYQRKLFRFRAPLVLLWLPALINVSALYWGMIYRLRYSVLLLPAVAIFGSLVLTAATAKRRALLMLVSVSAALPWISWYYAKTDPEGRLVAGPGAMILPAVGLVVFMIARARDRYDWALLAFCVLGMQVPPLMREYRPILGETLEHAFIEPERREVLQFLRRHYDGKRILIDMGKEAPLIYDSGLDVKDFVYNEGGEKFWNEAMRHPAAQVGWLCCERGDAIWERLQIDPGWASEYDLALKTEHFSLYRLKN